MSVDTTAELVNLISSLSEENFNQLVKNYLKAFYSTPHVRIVNGPYDGGNDLEVMVNGSEIKRNIQVTIQDKNFERKLEEDLAKAKKNVLEHNYLRKLDFYISKPLTKSKRNNLKLLAEVSYDIDLNIIDGNTLANEAGEFSIIRETVYEVFRLNSDDFIKIDKPTKIIYDVLALGKDTGAIKKEFIKSFILTFLFENPESTVEEIHEGLKPIFLQNYDINFYRNLLNTLKSQKILETPNEKTKFIISKEKEEEINGIYLSTSLEEQVLNEAIHKFLDEYTLSNHSADLVNLILESYKENYKIDVEEINSKVNSFNIPIKRIYNNIINFFTSKQINKDQAKKLTHELFDLCAENSYLTKIGVSLMFNSLFKSNKLEKYINQKEFSIYFDTQILLRYLCVLYNEKSQADHSITSIRELFQVLQKYKRNVKLYTTTDYIEEVIGQFQEAIKLQRFLSLPYVSNLGRTKNVFYNFYNDLRNESLMPKERTFLEFMESLLDIEYPKYNSPEFYPTVSNQLIRIFELAQIDVITYPTTFDNFFNIKKEYEVNLGLNDKNRSNTAIENDVRTALYLAKEENHINSKTGIFNEPFLVTWDTLFYSFRQRLLNTHDEYSYWYIYSPLKLADRISVVNFNINPSALNHNIVSIAESSFNKYTNTNSFFDVMSTLFNKEDIGDLNLIHKLMKLEEKTQNINDPIEQETDGKQSESPLTEMLLDLRNHYYKPESKFNVNDLISLLEDKTYEDAIVAIFEKNLEKLFSATSKKVDVPIFIEFDSLIETNKKQ